MRWKACPPHHKNAGRIHLLEDEICLSRVKFANAYRRMETACTNAGDLQIDINMS